ADQDLAGQAGAGVVGTPVQGGVDAADHMVEVLAAAAEVVVVHGVEHRRQAIALQLEGVVGAVAGGADQVVHALQQLRVVEDHRVQVEELADLVREGAVQAPAQAGQLAPGHLQGVVQAAQFAGNLVGTDAGFLDHQPLRLANAYPPQGDAPRSPLAAQGPPHQSSSSKRRSNSSAAAASASASSSPSARITRVEPGAAASSSTPMMLLALTSRPRPSRVTCDLKADSTCTSFAAARACSPSRLATLSSR